MNVLADMYVVATHLVCRRGTAEPTFFDVEVAPSLNPRAPRTRLITADRDVFDRAERAFVHDVCVDVTWQPETVDGRAEKVLCSIRGAGL